MDLFFHVKKLKDILKKPDTFFIFSLNFADVILTIVFKRYIFHRTLFQRDMLKELTVEYQRYGGNFLKSFFKHEKWRFDEYVNAFLYEKKPTTIIVLTIQIFHKTSL